MEVQITCDNLKLGYGAGVLVDGLSFTVEKGDYLCIVGENGAGKSTLLRTLLGLQKPLAGKITFGGGLQQNEIGYLPQQTFVQRDFPASVWEVVLSGCQGRCGLRPFYNREEKQIAKNAMEQLEIIPLARTCYRDLSGGQQQRVLLARALCASDKMLVLDEPVSGLDPKMAETMYRLVERINREMGITVIMISHDILEAIPYATHILHMGREYFFGTVEEYRRSCFGNAFLQPE
ncbi:ABC transporter ATP-binding protein [uncultured Succiniclasticum sp.]|jgi:zinc transport system ATP-binding protein|uniref:metal ABC transporter ATP-binding protein n=1 Tax=uncultured Succiniclasticum sp. TaxID=1500547 RepID=UPI0025D9022E|nr:ABC transporter ATP-binding protein [uncultured Succiniclasticum sp.]